MVQRSMRAAQPSRVMAEYGFGPLTLVDRFPVSMSGADWIMTTFAVCVIVLPYSRYDCSHATIR